MKWWSRRLGYTKKMESCCASCLWNRGQTLMLTSTLNSPAICRLDFDAVERVCGSVCTLVARETLVPIFGFAAGMMGPLGVKQSGATPPLVIVDSSLQTGGKPLLCGAGALDIHVRLDAGKLIEALGSTCRVAGIVQHGGLIN
jgi:hypothetical protein